MRLKLKKRRKLLGWKESKVSEESLPGRSSYFFRGKAGTGES